MARNTLSTFDANADFVPSFQSVINTIEDHTRCAKSLRPDVNAAIECLDRVVLWAHEAAYGYDAPVVYDYRALYVSACGASYALRRLA